MKTVFLDYETYYSQEYSLRKMTPVEYVLDPRFECIGAAVKEGADGESYWVDGTDLRHFFADLDPADTSLVTHNALFDMCITEWRYNFRPKLMVDTLGMARAMIGHRCKSLSLANVATTLGLGVKGDTVHKVIGMNAVAIKQAGLYDSYIQYAINDVELCAGIYQKLIAMGYPARELVVMDMVLRCAIQPKMLLDQNVLAEHLQTIRAQKDQVLAMAMLTSGVTDVKELMSNNLFASLLRNLGVEPPTKVSLVTGQQSFAFAKTDPAFIELEEHDDPRVQALVAARLGHKSTLEETRTERFMKIAQLQWPSSPQGRMPMPLRYSGAHTHRLSGDWSLNVQNMPRGGALRRAIIAPPDHQILAADASQIEARIVAWICGQKDLIQQFENKEDVYSVFASRIFERTITKADKAERFLGKTCILGMGYGVGWAKLQKTVKLQSKAQTGQVIDLSDEEALRIVSLYRTTYSGIPATWKKLDGLISALAQGRTAQFGPCAIEDGTIRLPSGLRLNYHKLSNTSDGWMYEYAGKPKKLYGGSLLENIVQALARIVVMDAAMRIRTHFAKLDIQLSLQVHDELVYVVDNEAASVCKQIVLEEMRRRPSWAPDLPLDAEADLGPSYGDAK
jgi:DNA polymerase